MSNKYSEQIAYLGKYLEARLKDYSEMPHNFVDFTSWDGLKICLIFAKDRIVVKIDNDKFNDLDFLELQLPEYEDIAYSILYAWDTVIEDMLEDLWEDHLDVVNFVEKHKYFESLAK